MNLFDKFDLDKRMIQRANEIGQMLVDTPLVTTSTGVHPFKTWGKVELGREKDSPMLTFITDKEEWIEGSEYENSKTVYETEGHYRKWQEKWSVLVPLAWTNLDVPLDNVRARREEQEAVLKRESDRKQLEAQVRSGEKKAAQAREKLESMGVEA